MLVIENNQFRAEFDPRGAAIDTLFFKPIARNVLRSAPEGVRKTPFHYHGTVVGPLANRVGGARFLAGETEFRLDQNEGRNALHGGFEGLSEVVWDVRLHETHELVFGYEWPQGQGGLSAAKFEVRYALVENSLKIDMTAEPEADTAINMAPHLYFTAPEGLKIDALEMQIHAAHYLPVDDEKIPTGEVAGVAGTAFDFRNLKRIDDTKIDHNFCLDGADAIVLQARDFAMQVETNQKGLQIYTGDHLERAAIAIEPQGWPNAVNEPRFPSQWVSADALYESVSTFSFVARSLQNF